MTTSTAVNGDDPRGALAGPAEVHRVDLTPSALVTVAAERQPGPPRIRIAGERWRRADEEITWQPVGVRHAVRISDARGGQRRTLCGVAADDWHIWTDLELGRHGGDCRRCAQLADG